MQGNSTKQWSMEGCSDSGQYSERVIGSRPNLSIEKKFKIELNNFYDY